MVLIIVGGMGNEISVIGIRTWDSYVTPHNCEKPKEETVDPDRFKTKDMPDVILNNVEG